jgi:hypothetical protein
MSSKYNLSKISPRQQPYIKALGVTKKRSKDLTYTNGFKLIITEAVSLLDKRVICCYCLA